MPHRCYRREGGVAEALTGGAELATTVIWPLASVFAWWHRRSGRRCSSGDGGGLGRGGRCAVRGVAVNVTG